MQVNRPSSGHVASNSTPPSVSAPVPEPVSALTSIRAVRSQFSALESAFKFPPILEFDHSELGVSSNEAPVRAYEHSLNGLLERLDAIESDGNEEVRDVRRGVVREVERALEEVERKVKGRAPQAPVPEVTNQEASDVEREDPGASATQAVPPAVVHVTEGAKPTLLNLAPVASQADADIDVAISAEYQSASAIAIPAGVVVAERDSAAGAAPSNGEVSTVSGADTEAFPASEDASDSVATITPTSAVPVPSSSNKFASTSAGAAETFLTSLSHDQFTFPPRPAFSQSSTNSGVPHDDDTVLVDNSSEGGSVRSVDDEWTAEFDA
jgi:BAG domain